MSLRISTRFTIFVAVLALAVGAIACGDDDGDAASERSPTTQPADRGEASTGDAREPDATAPSAKRGQRARPPRERGNGTPAERETPRSDADRGDSEQQRIATIVAGMYRDFAQGDAAGVCAAMSRQARQQIAQGAVPSGDKSSAGRSCAATFSEFLDVAAASGLLERTLQARVHDVEIDDDVARARVSFGGPSGDVQLVKENGEWRFGIDALRQQGG